LSAAAAPAFAIYDVGAYVITTSPTAVMVTFANGPDSRGFSWQTDTTVTESEVRLVAGAVSPADFETTSTQRGIAIAKGEKIIAESKA
jgi:hypothetical protein